MTHPPPEPPPATCPTCLTPAGEQNPCKSGKFQDQVQITFAVHLIESGVEVNVIRAWLGHADLSTTNRYARRNQHQNEAGGTASMRASGYFGGTPDQPGLALR